MRALLSLFFPLACLWKAASDLRLPVSFLSPSATGAGSASQHAMPRRAGGYPLGRGTGGPLVSASGKVLASFLIAAFLLFANLPAAPAAVTTTTIPAVADAFVQSSKPTANQGGSSSLRIRNSIKISYVRFDPALPPSAEVSAATLRVYASTGAKCSLGVEVLRAANDTWGETTITWRNQPGPTGGVISRSFWTAKGYRDFDVTSAVTGAGLVSFVLRHAAGCNVNIDASLTSREASSNRPQLIIATDTPPPPAPACSDGLDNDADGRIDFPTDPGCADAADTDETDTPPPPGNAKVVMAAGDIVCQPTSSTFGGADPNVCQHRATGALLAGADAILPLGDLQYLDGTLEQFMRGYDPSWGLEAPRTYPAIGNHEYHDPGAQGYFGYWASKGRPTGASGSGFYSFDLGSWHLISLNSNCSTVPCSEASPQNDFLEQDLANTSQTCIAAYWHHPYFNSGAEHGQSMPSGAKAFWDDLLAAGADIVLNGHEHNYQRYAKQDAAGQARSDGIREFVVGTGGKSHYALLEAKDPNFEAGVDTDFGVLRLYLGDTSYTWEFVGVGGAVLDAGGPVPCN